MKRFLIVSLEHSFTMLPMNHKLFDRKAYWLDKVKLNYYDSIDYKQTNKIIISNRDSYEAPMKLNAIQQGNVTLHITIYIVKKPSLFIM